MDEKRYYVYILSNHANTTLYIGVTGNINRRMYEHKNGLIDGFTKKYNVTKLVYAEYCTDIKAALEREKQLKRWRREKKNELINSVNPEWKDLTED
ncbi:MAG: GIY-YIG nuclease family protein [Clostridia bacterium]|nr:GIY-YIG nuclease family protein [Clostridia bacterium]